MRTMFTLGLATVIGLAFGTAGRADEVGPHKGPVAEWGEEDYHLEVVADAKTGDVMVYVYSGDHEELKKGKTKPIDAKTITLSLKTTEPATTLKLEAKPAKDDPEGKCSVFVGKHDAFKSDKKLVGVISGKVGTKVYTGEFKQK